MQTEDKKNVSVKFLIIVSAACFIIGALGEWLAVPAVAKLPIVGKIINPVPNTVVEIRTGGYKFINPLLECESAQNAFSELTPFRDKISALADKINASSDAIDFVSVYFRDLNNGLYFSVNPTASFTPASLLKLPLLVAYFKLAEAKPDILKQAYVFTDNATIDNVTQMVPPEQVLQNGQSYTTQELLRRMIIYSDNRAQYLLLNHADMSSLQQVYSDFGISLPSDQNPNPQVTVQQYAGFLRILFNASYLNAADSELALEWLSQSEFKDGLVAGVPGNIAVAHKFGERELTDANQSQLHDCGIVYYPKHPYLLCVMTRGKGLPNLSKAIAQVSQAVYSEVDSQYSQ
jgi:beta-lactamase class A